MGRPLGLGCSGFGLEKPQKTAQQEAFWRRSSKLNWQKAPSAQELLLCAKPSRVALGVAPKQPAKMCLTDCMYSNGLACHTCIAPNLLRGTLPSARLILTYLLVGHFGSGAWNFPSVQVFHQLDGGHLRSHAREIPRAYVHVPPSNPCLWKQCGALKPTKRLACREAYVGMAASELHNSAY